MAFTLVRCGPGQTISARPTSYSNRRSRSAPQPASLAPYSSSATVTKEIEPAEVVDATAHEDSVLSVDVHDIDAAYALAQAIRLLPDYDKCQAYIADVHSAFRSGS